MKSPFTPYYGPPPAKDTCAEQLIEGQRLEERRRADEVAEPLILLFIRH